MTFMVVNAFPQEMAAKVGGHYENGFVGSFYSRIDGKELTFGLTEKQANQLSVWKTSMANPPVAVRQAIQSARKKLEELFPAKRVWKIEDVTLKPVVFTLDAKDGVELSETAKKFFDYATSAEAAEIISAAGAVPVN